VAVADWHLAEPPAGVSRAIGSLALVLVIAAAAAGLIAGGTADSSAVAGAPIKEIEGVPVGVLHSRGGAVAAADDYVLVDQQTIEQDPTRLASLVRQNFAHPIQAEVLAQAQTARAQDPRGMALWASAGRSASLIGAHRLDAYDGRTAEVTSWVGTIYWGPGQPPKQAWDLARTWLRWAGGRWLVTSIRTRLPIPGPVPASTPQADAADDNAGVFDNALAGFGALGTGAPSG
jgi:hypothetical protein